MVRKWMILGASMTFCTTLLAGFSMADDDDSPLHKLMEKVGKQNNAIKKSIRTEVAYKKAISDGSLVKVTDELIKLGKESRAFTEPAEKEKKTQEEWTKLVDDFVAKTEKFKGVIGKGDAAAAKDSVKGINASCTSCHDVFKKE